MVAIPVAFALPWLADLLYASVAALWFVPDKRIERIAFEEAPAEPAAEP